GQDDEIHDNVREEHADGDVPGRIFQLPLGSTAALPKPLSTSGNLFLNLLAGLPEEKVRRNRRAQDGDQGRPERAVQTNRGKKRPLENRRPIRSREKRRADVSEKSKRQPLEYLGDEPI